MNGLFFTDISDHLPIFMIDHRNMHSTTERVYRARNFNDKNMAKFSRKLDSVNWENLFLIEDGRQAFTMFYDKYLGIFNETFPVKVNKSNYQNRKPWLTEGLKKSIKIKNKLYLKQLRNHTEENVTIYKRYKHSLSKLISSCERMHYNELLQQNKNNMRKTWLIIKEIINKNKQSSPPNKFKFGDRIENNPSVIADKFNHFFRNVGTDLARQISESNIDPLNYIHESSPSSLFLRNTDEEEVEKIILSLKHPSAGNDDVHAKVVKATYKNYLSPLTYILNLS
jgi:hypothetical protein